MRSSLPLEAIQLVPFLHDLRKSGAASGLIRIVYGTTGPVLVAGAHFAISLIAWGGLSPASFGLFSFIFLMVQLLLGLHSALIGTPLSVPPAGSEATIRRHRNACLSVNTPFIAGAAVLVGAVAAAASETSVFILYALFAAAATFRWSSRSEAMAREARGVAVGSDTLYSFLLLAGAGFQALAGTITIDGLLLTLSGASLAAALAVNGGFLKEQAKAIGLANLAAYRELWHTQTKWSLSSVIAMEAPANAHAYAITIFYGPAAFAPIAFASLFFRPLAVFLGSILLIERPLIARRVRENDRAGARKLVLLSLGASATFWLINSGAAAGMLLLAAEVIASKRYDIDVVTAAVGLWAAIMGAKAIRVPLSSLLQAQSQFRALAAITAKAAVASVVIVLLLVQFGAIYALGGVLLGETFLSMLLFYRVRKAPKSVS